MTPTDQIILRSYAHCIRKMFEAIGSLGLPIPSEVILWLQDLERQANGG